MRLRRVPGLLNALTMELHARGIELSAWALAWARVVPLVTLLPAFGARLLPAVGRVVLGLALALLLVPATAPLAREATAASLPLLLLMQVLAGLPLALSASALLWAASMAGGLVDELRGAGQSSGLNVLEPGNNALGSLFGLFAALGFLTLGGVGRVIERLAQPLSASRLWYLEAARDLAAAIGVALALAVPLLVLVIIVEVASALIARAASPAHIRSLLGPLRSLAILGGLGLALDAIFLSLLEQLG